MTIDILPNLIAYAFFLSQLQSSSCTKAHFVLLRHGRLEVNPYNSTGVIGVLVFLWFALVNLWVKRILSRYPGEAVPKFMANGTSSLPHWALGPHGRSMRSSEAEELWEAVPKLSGLSGHKLCDLLYVLGAARSFRYHRRVAEQVAKSMVISQKECLGLLANENFTEFLIEKIELENPSYGNFSQENMGSDFECHLFPQMWNALAEMGPEKMIWSKKKPGILSVCVYLILGDSDDWQWVFKWWKSIYI